MIFEQRRDTSDDKYKKTIYPLRTSPFHPSLRLHPLHGKHRDFHSVYIDRRYGIMLEFVIDKGKIILLDIGTHQIY